MGLRAARLAFAIRNAGHFLKAQLRSEAGVVGIGVTNREYVLERLKDHDPKVIRKPSEAIRADQQALLSVLRQPGNEKNLADGESWIVISPEKFKGSLIPDLRDLQKRKKIKEVKVIYEKLAYIDRRPNISDLAFDQITEGTVLDDAEYTKSFRPFIFFELADEETAAEAERWFDFGCDPRKIVKFRPKSSCKPF